MQFSVFTETLVNAVQIVSKAAASKTSIPALTGIYIEAHDNNNLLLKATDLELGIECIIKADIEEKGVMVIPAKYFMELLRKLPPTMLTFFTQEDHNQLNIKFYESQISLNTFPPEQFSFLPDLKNSNSITIDHQLLSNMIKKIIFSISNDLSRPVLNGALLEINNDKIRMVSSDFYRLSMVELNMEKLGGTSFKPVIIPGKALIEVARFTFKDDLVTIGIDDNQVQFEGDNFNLRVRLISGVFPSYANVIPEEYLTRIVVDTRELLLCVERAAVVASDVNYNKNCIVNLEIKEETLLMKAYSPNIGQVNDKIFIEKEGEDLNISFNSNYLIEALKVIDTEKTIIEFGGHLSPGIIKPYEAHMDFLTLILPVRQG
ncbi:MAG: DNA polymerase III subunit beta [Bacillota bacterium]